MNAVPADFLNPDSLPETLARLDKLIEQSENEEKIRAGLGMRLALSMAQELKSGKPLGSETALLVAEWVERFGQDTVDMAIGVARSFLIQPDKLTREFGQRLGALGIKADP